MILDKTVERNGQSDWAKIEVAAWKPCKKNPTVFFSLRVNIVKALIYWDMSTAQEVSTEDGGRILREYTA